MIETSVVWRTAALRRENVLVKIEFAKLGSMYYSEVLIIQDGKHKQEDYHKLGSFVSSEL